MTGGIAANRREKDSGAATITYDGESNTMITFNRINGFFNQLTELPDQNALSPAGSAALAEWGEQQPWWSSFAVHHRLGGDWRSTPMGDSYLFVVNLYRFLNSPVPYREGQLRERDNL